MTTPVIRLPQTVVLRSTDWVDELAGELIRLGHKREVARRSAAEMLKRILERSGWPAACFALDESSEAEVERPGHPG